MDIGYIPAPPPEEFEESRGAGVPQAPTPSDWDHNNGSPYINHTPPTSVPNIADNGAAWQRAMEALNQTQAGNSTGYASYGGSAYGALQMPIMLPPNWSQPSYGYATNYQTSYSTQPSSMYAGNQFNHGQGVGYARSQLATQYSQPVQAVQQRAQEEQAQEYRLHSQTAQPTQQSPQTYSAPSSQQSSTASSPFPTRTQQTSFGRVRQARPKYSPYAYSSTSTQSTMYGQSTPSTQGTHSTHSMVQSGGLYEQYGSYQTGPPPDAAAASSLASATERLPTGGDGLSVEQDMEIDHDQSATAGYPHTFSQKQAPGAGGIRFQLSKKSGEVKVPNALLQKRLLLSSALPSTTSINNGSSFTGSTPSTPSQASLDFLTNLQSNDWPANLQSYVAKAIRITPPEKHQRVMQTITQMITTSYKTNTLFTTKWENAPMPYANESANELFGLSPKRENESPPPSTSVSFRTPSSRGGRGGGRNADNVRRGRVSGHRTSDSEDDTSSHQGSTYSGGGGGGSVTGGGRGGKGNSRVSRWDTDEKKASPEVEFLPLHAKGSLSAGNKARLFKPAQGTLTPGQPRPKGKLMGFGVEAAKSAEDVEKLRKRQERFNAGGTSSPGVGVKPLNKPKKATSKSPGRGGGVGGVGGVRRGVSTVRTVVGTCQTVEKEYFRLTEAVDASQVRPLTVLAEALILVKEKWKKEHNYRYAESQLKSIRQDLRVQHVFSPFTVQVYETHARIALEVSDQAEFTQCLSQLEWLYDTLTAIHRSQGVGVASGCENRLEFLSYRILYVMRQNRTTDVTRVRMQLSEEDKKDECIVFAFSLLSAFFAGDYQQFFSLYDIAPRMAGYVIQVSIPQFRQRIFVKICTAYRPNLPVTALKEILRLTNEKELREFLKAYKLTYTWMNGVEEVDCKASLPVVKAGPQTVTDTPSTPSTPSKPSLVTARTVTARPISKTRRKFKASMTLGH